MWWEKVVSTSMSHDQQPSIILRLRDTTSREISTVRFHLRARAWHTIRAHLFVNCIAISTRSSRFHAILTHNCSVNKAKMRNGWENRSDVDVKKSPAWVTWACNYNAELWLTLMRVPEACKVFSLLFFPAIHTQQHHMKSIKLNIIEINPNQATTINSRLWFH